jgi:hypothetical protein
MATNENKHLLDKGAARISSLFHRWMDRVNFSMLRQTIKPADPSDRDLLRASEYLEICLECAAYAHTVEDALYWQNEIITELSVELNRINATRWSAAVKTNMSFVLQERLAHHATAASRLTAVLARNERLSWQP